MSKQRRESDERITHKKSDDVCGDDDKNDIEGHVAIIAHPDLLKVGGPVNLEGRADDAVDHSGTPEAEKRDDHASGAIDQVFGAHDHPEPPEAKNKEGDVEVDAENQLNPD